MCTCVRACVCACVRACVRACVCVCDYFLIILISCFTHLGQTTVEKDVNIHSSFFLKLFLLSLYHFS